MKRLVCDLVTLVGGLFGRSVWSVRRSMPQGNLQEILLSNSCKNVYSISVQSIESKILSRIQGHGRGWVFSRTDLLDLGPGTTIDSALSRLSHREAIRRIDRGLYDYPRHSVLLGEALLPDMTLVAEAIARRHNWRIVPDGNTALYVLGLTRQVPARVSFFSTGPTRSFDIMGTALRLKHRKTSHTAIEDRNTAVLVQALEALGPDRLTAAEKRHIGSLFSWRELRRMVRAGRTASTWIHDTIKEIADSAAEEEPVI